MDNKVEEVEYKKKRKTDKLVAKIPEIMVPVIFIIIGWGIKQEISDHIIKRDVAEIERKIQIQWGKIDINEKGISEMETADANHSQRAEEAIDNSKEKICELKDRVFRLESIVMEEKEE